ncbi:MAG: hypothetical protein WDZ35_15895 [Crocinitomicaceae bacterium]
MKKSIFIIFGLLLLISCKKEVTTPNNGIYRGVYKEITVDQDTLVDALVFLVLHEENQSFTVKGDSLTNFPPDHNGTYEIIDEKQMNFEYKGVYEYNPNHYLDTTFNYTFDDVNFTLSRKESDRTFEYKMKRY